MRTATIAAYFLQNLRRLYTQLADLQGHLAPTSVSVSVLNMKVLLALVGCAFLLAFLFPAPESTRVVAFGERPLAWSEKMAAAVLGT